MNSVGSNNQSLKYDEMILRNMKIFNLPPFVKKVVFAQIEIWELR